MNRLLLDFRSPSEYATGHLHGALLVPAAVPPETNWDDVQRYLLSILEGKSLHIPITVYCAKGIRSRVAAGILRDLGFTNVTDIGGVHRGRLSREIAAGRRLLVV